MDAVAIARHVVEQLPPETQAALSDVEIVLRDRPSVLDLERGATPNHRGYFYGVSPEPCTGTELPDDTTASGQIVVFIEAHASALELERTILHEIGHATGHSEQELCEVMGLGC